MKKDETLILPSPKEIKEYLDLHVIGQDEAKKVLSVAVYNHYKKVINNLNNHEIEFDKSNIVMLGETGCGKTLLVKTIAKMLDIPCYIQDCTKITASGYVGSDVEECLVGLLRTCKYNIKAAEMGIVVLDEGDKIAKKEAGVSITRDVSGECVQQSLLKIVEGDLVGVQPEGGRKHPEQQLLYVNTKNILFILSGAFVGLEDIIKNRMSNNSTIGFETLMDDDKVDVDNIEVYNQYASPQDLREFGFIPEFIGRFPIITNVNPLKEEDLVRILEEPKNSIVKQFKEMLKMDNIDLDFEKDALIEIAKLALSLKTGARALRNIMETVMTDIMFDISGNENGRVVITKEMATERVKNKFLNIAA